MGGGEWGVRGGEWSVAQQNLLMCERRCSDFKRGVVGEREREKKSPKERDGIRYLENFICIYWVSIPIIYFHV